MISLFLRDIFECGEYRSKLQAQLDLMHRHTNRFIEIHELFSLTSDAMQSSRKKRATRDVLIFMKNHSQPGSDWEFFMKIIKPMPLLLNSEPTKECHAWKDVGLGFLVVDAELFKPFVTQLWKKTAYENKGLLLSNLRVANRSDVVRFLCANPECRTVAWTHLLQEVGAVVKALFAGFRRLPSANGSTYAVDLLESGTPSFPPIEAYVLNALVEDHLYTERTITMLVETAWHGITGQPYPQDRKVRFQNRLTRMRSKYRFPVSGDGGRDPMRRLAGHVWFGVRFKEAFLREQVVEDHRERLELPVVSKEVVWGLHA